MCIFSQPVEIVSDTKIFARIDGDSQFIVYSMTYSASQELAMVLPIPVPENPSDDAVDFINLQTYPNFFDDMNSGFPARLDRSLNLEEPLRAAVLEVHDVGDFEASFIPTISDFKRLDTRFRLPDHIWSELPIYSDYGFAVFESKIIPIFT